MTELDAGAGAGRLSSAYAELRGGFELAGTRLGVAEHRLRIGSQAIELRMAGDAMAEAILPALQHLTDTSSVPAEPDLVVRAWDTASSGSRLPDLSPVRDGAVGHSLYEGEVCLSFRMWDSAVSSLHVGRGEAVHCVANVHHVAPYDVAHPLSEIFAWWMSRSDCYRVHAAAVGTSAGGVLLTGASGAGKSTSALACLHAGMQFAGDDQVLVRADPPVAISLYNSGRADRDLLDRYPDVFPRLELASGEGKAVSFFAREAMTHEIPLRAVVLPRIVAGGVCRTRVGSRAAALLALAPWAVIHSPGAGEKALGSIRDLLSVLPVHTLEVGDDPSQMPVLLSELIEESVPCS